MLKKLLIAWLVIAAALGLAAGLLDSVRIHGGILSLLVVALVFALVHTLIGPLLKLVSAPVTLMTLGLFSVVVNGILLAITAGISDALDVGGVVGVIVAAALISVLLAVLRFVVEKALPSNSPA